MERDKDETFLVIIIFFILMIICTTIIPGYIQKAKNIRTYELAIERMKEEDYQAAIDLFESIKPFRDSENKIAECYNFQGYNTCPHCGGRLDRRLDLDPCHFCHGLNREIITSGTLYCVICKDCGTITKPYDVLINAVAAWNNGIFLEERREEE